MIMDKQENKYDLFNLRGKSAIITGGGSGIGMQAVMAFARAGCRITIADIRSPEKVCLQIERKYGVEALPLEMDITIEDNVTKMIKSTLEKFEDIDILVNNVGGAIISDTLRTTLSDWHRIMDLNVTSMFLCCRAAGRHMIDKKYGKIINIASVYGLRGTDPRNYIPEENISAGNSRESLSFTSSKAAVINLTRDLAVNWARYNITVNSISPGAFITGTTKKIMDDHCIKKITERIPMGRWGGEDDLKGSFIFLASDASKYITGHDLVVDGGWTAWC